MSNFGARVRELRKAKGHTLRSLAPSVGVGFTYLSKIESGKLDFGDAPSADLIERLAEVLDTDADELLLMAGRIPQSIREAILDEPRLFRELAKFDRSQLRNLLTIKDRPPSTPTTRAARNP